MPTDRRKDHFAIGRMWWDDDEPWWHSSGHEVGPLTRWQAIWYLLRTDLGER